MRHLGLFLLLAGLLGCMQAEQPGWKYVGSGSDQYEERSAYCTEWAIYQFPMAHFDEEMDEEEFQEENYGRPMSPRFEKKFARCMEQYDWRQVS